MLQCDDLLLAIPDVANWHNRELLILYILFLEKRKTEIKLPLLNL
jgi:hypothetical protein